MDEASLCEKIALIQNGEILSIDTPEKIVNQYPKPLYAIKSPDMSRLLKSLRNNEMIESANAFGEYHHITLSGDGMDSEKVLASLDMGGLEMKPIKPTIEDCFINLM